MIRLLTIFEGFPQEFSALSFATCLVMEPKVLSRETPFDACKLAVFRHCVLDLLVGSNWRLFGGFRRGGRGQYCPSTPA